MPLSEPPSSPQGWLARLELSFAERDALTYLRTNRHTGPLRLQRVLYPESAVCHACILHPPGGVVGGDRLEIHTAVEASASALITTPGATKFYRSGGAPAVQENYLEVQEEASLEWLPQESIVYPGAVTTVSTRVNLAKGACFMGWEILCVGLPACGQPFATGTLRNTLDIRRAGRPLFADRLRLTDADDRHRPTGLRGHSVSAIFIATGCKPDMLTPLRQLFTIIPNTLTGITLMDDLLVARYLGECSSEAKTLFQALWTWLRPYLSGRTACPPRIWAT
ncbi:MAG: hypothetical protein VR64_12980 [Desulfatitalea sp. BRH_c12]|nr:MAG: hypothetical protein VR64_12980 [Desulfatitalea sp. BRH_c12]